MKKTHLSILALLLCMLFAACEKAVFEENNQKPEPKPNDKNAMELVFNITQFEQTDFSGLTAASRAVSIGEVCSRINLAVYQDGARVKYVNQKTGDSNFGRISLTLPQGNYELVVLAHSCDGNATMTTLNKLTFPNNKLTDTFYCYMPLSVTSNGEHNLTLSRAVAMVRFQIEDAMPSSVKKMKFYYTGGSSTFDPVAGYGCVNSKQTEYRDVTASMVGQPTTFELFTLPHADNGELKMTISALDASENVVKEMTLEQIPVTINKITQYSGKFFDGTGGGGGSGESNASEFVFYVEQEWEGTNNYSY